jgi:nitrous-oxide reductase
MILLLPLSLLAGCSRNKEMPAPAVQGSLPADAMSIASARGLSPDDINAALMTYMPSGSGMSTISSPRAATRAT